MFKNYLSYQFAVSFDQSCSAQALPAPEKLELLRCSRAMMNHFATAIRSEVGAERSRCFFVALMYLRDCRDLLDAAKIDETEIGGRLSVLEGRLVQLCEQASEAEKGQMRMLG